MEEYECFMEQNFIKSPVFSEIEYLWNYLYFWQVLRYFFYFQEANFLGSSGELGAPAPQRKKKKKNYIFFSFCANLSQNILRVRSSPRISLRSFSDAQNNHPGHFTCGKIMAYRRFPEESHGFHYVVKFMRTISGKHGYLR